VIQVEQKVLKPKNVQKCEMRSTYSKYQENFEKKNSKKNVEPLFSFLSIVLPKKCSKNFEQIAFDTTKQ
jgi:CRISPR/Cas system CSM-associated protein Csm2 small subunit